MQAKNRLLGDEKHLAEGVFGFWRMGDWCCV
jgi:hypothetical protein